jgi:SAM-dependent methyltransferase
LSGDPVVADFSALAARYASFRPHYPAALSGALAERCTRHDVAVDLGCGSGQLTTDLAPHFARVVGVDPSQPLLDAAPTLANVEYRCAAAEATGLPAASADLVVAAQAAHWFDWPRFVAEVARIARPGALVALVSYGVQRLEGDAMLAIDRYRAAIAAYWPAGREHVENGYRDLVLPWPAVEAPAIEMVESWTRAELVGYVSSWSATHRLVKRVGSAAFDAFVAELTATWPDDERRSVRWPLAIKLARR